MPLRALQLGDKGDIFPLHTSFYGIPILRGYMEMVEYENL